MTVRPTRMVWRCASTPSTLSIGSQIERSTARRVSMSARTVSTTLRSMRPRSAASATWSRTSAKVITAARSRTPAATGESRFNWKIRISGRRVVPVDEEGHQHHAGHRSGDEVADRFRQSVVLGDGQRQGERHGAAQPTPEHRALVAGIDLLREPESLEDRQQAEDRGGAGDQRHDVKQTPRGRHRPSSYCRRSGARTSPPGGRSASSPRSRSGPRRLRAAPRSPQ